MFSLDTNILVRYAVKDDLYQEQLAVAVLTEYHCFILTSVLLETVWVLESVYQYSKVQIHERLLHIFGLPNIAVEAYPAVITALESYIAGMDFADALHIALSEYQGKQGVITFDKKFANAAKRLDIEHPVNLIRSSRLLG